MPSHYLLDLLQGRLIGENVKVNGISLHSDLVSEGDLFVALSSERYHAERFIEQAITQGAQAIAIETMPEKQYPVSLIVVDDLRDKLAKIASLFYQNPSKNLHLIGVTGTNGKSSIVDYIRQGFDLLTIKATSIGTLGFISQNRQATINTTPDTLSLNRMLFESLESASSVVSMEVSSHALAQHRTEGILFNTAIFSNLTQDHLDYHKTMQAYAESKALLFASPELKCAIVNHSDPYTEYMLAALSTKTKVVRYAIEDASADVYFKQIRLTPQGYQLVMDYQGQSFNFISKLIGRFNLANLLAAIIALVEYGLNINKVAQIAEQVKPVIGRMQLVELPSNKTIIVDYAHTPDALENILIELSALCEGKLHVVFGCGGDRDRSKRSLMGEVAYKWADQLWVTSDNPRSEKPADIIQDIVAGISQDKVSLIEDRRQAIQSAVQALGPLDILVVAGKGHEQYQQIGKQKLPFDDVFEVKQAFTLSEASQ